MEPQQIGQRPLGLCEVLVAILCGGPESSVHSEMKVVFQRTEQASQVSQCRAWKSGFLVNFRVKVKVLVTQSCPNLFSPVDSRVFCSWDSPGKNTRVRSLSLLHRVFPTQGLNKGLLHCRQSLYQLSPQGSPKLPRPLNRSAGRGKPV